jgi:CDP-diacylglycerol--serine O-phosphatidyltransferase
MKEADIHKSDKRKFAFFLPNIFTALNLACGFACILNSWQGHFYQAGMFLVLGAIFDSVDGRVARLLGVESGFGEQFDSMSDVVSFGVAPAILVYNRFFTGLGRLGMVVAFIYLLCTALRLARFNANHDRVSSNFFQGLPSPAAAFGLIGYVFFSLEYSEVASWPILSISYVVFYSLLMISNIPFCSFKDSPWVRRHKRFVLAIIFLTGALGFMYEELMIGVLISTYVLGSLIYLYRRPDLSKEVFTWENEGEVEE